MNNYEVILKKIKALMLVNPRGMAVSEIARKIGLNRNSVAKYLEILKTSGHVEMKGVGPAKMFFLSQRVPLSSMIDFASDYISVLGSNLNILKVNDNFLKLMDAKKDDLIGKNIDDLSAPLLQNIKPEIKKALEGKESKKTITYMKGKKKLYFSSKVLPTIFDDGKEGVTLILENVTEKKKSEKQIKDHHEFLNSVIESLTHPFYVVDANDYTIKLANSAAKFGDLSKKPKCYELTHHTDKPCGSKEHPCPIEDLKKTKKPVSVEHIHYDEEGNKRNVEINAFPIFDNEGEVKEIIEYTVDVTEKKKALEKLKKSEEKFSAYLGLVGVIMIAIDGQGIVTYINKKGSEVLKYDVDEIVGKNWSDNFIPKRLRKRVNGVAKKLLSGEIEPAEYFENPIVTRTGEERMIAWHNTVIRDKKGVIISHLSSGEDITEKKKAEEDLIESEGKFRQFFENAPEYCYMVSPEGKIIDVNKNALDALGYDKEELVGKPVITTIYSKESQEKAKKLFMQWKKTGVLKNQELTIVTKGGEERTVLLDVTVIKDKDGRIVNSISFQKDISYLKS